MESMGGTVGAGSEVGIGSRFWIELPIADISRIDTPDGIKGSTAPASQSAGIAH